jgi:general secretion pathway protein D
VFTRKMEERQEFIDRYFVFNADWEPPRDYSRTNGLVEEIRKAFATAEEKRRLELELAPGEERIHQPTDPLDLPVDVAPGGAAPAPGAPAAPAAPSRRRRSEVQAPTTGAVALEARRLSWATPGEAKLP